MPESAGFLEALKRCLKAKGLTYGTLAKRLDLSEASVKRIFAEGTLSLERIGQVLEILEMSFLDVAKLSSDGAKPKRNVMTLEQESRLAKDDELLAYYHLLLFGKTPEEILKAFKIAPTAAAKHLETLSDIGLVERRGRGVKLLLGRRVTWRDAGPLRTAYRDQILNSFLEGDFAGERRSESFMTRSLSPASQALLRRKFEQLKNEIDELSRLDGAAAKDKTEVMGMLLAIRPFSFVPSMALTKRRGRD